ncbi:hypothetical protein [uncultured Algimonas sp.]|uniref:hypothetical protein n=1 Tax=uncultured Algimonas sp. TaxID=1547920 RepID=UPI00263526C3|nr:hypothetical protein [uncultured Algimonas sp.]
MSLPNLTRYTIIGMWVLYVIALMRIVPLFFGAADPTQNALAAFHIFSQTFLIPVGVWIAIVMGLQLRRPAREREIHRKDERRRQLAAKSATAGFWILLFGNVLALTIGLQSGWHLAIVVTATILAFGAGLLLAAADEFDMIRLEESAD